MSEEELKDLVEFKPMPENVRIELEKERQRDVEVMAILLDEDLKNIYDRFCFETTKKASEFIGKKIERGATTIEEYMVIREVVIENGLRFFKMITDVALSRINSAPSIQASNEKPTHH